ncbi:MAG TPA: YdcF family protein [Anaeromyxobacter sp.]|nr:YdcF family protein [Anaeromyxobacter sp.]
MLELGQSAPEIARDLNAVADFLALRDLAVLEAEELDRVCGARSADGLVLLANAVLRTAEAAFQAVREGLAELLVISGGEGHSTPHLRSVIRRHPRYRAILTEGRSEAEMVGRMAVEHWALDPARVILETRSTSCGENATRTRAELTHRGLLPRRLVLLQDPTMQRRSDASFRKAFQGGPATEFINYPTLVPRVRASAGVLEFDDPDPSSLWTMERFITLVMGEIPRLRDDERGYGPRGRGFIPHVEIPEEIDSAHARLLKALGAGERG